MQAKSWEQTWVLYTLRVLKWILKLLFKQTHRFSLVPAKEAPIIVVLNDLLDLKCQHAYKSLKCSLIFPTYKGTEQKFYPSVFYWFGFADWQKTNKKLLKKIEKKNIRACWAEETSKNKVFFCLKSIFFLVVFWHFLSLISLDSENKN